METRLIIINDCLIKIQKSNEGYDVFQWKPNMATMRYSWQRFSSNQDEQSLSEYLDHANEIYEVRDLKNGS